LNGFPFADVILGNQKRKEVEKDMETDERSVGRRSVRGSRWLAVGALGAVALVAAACSSGGSTSTTTTGGGGSSTPTSGAAAAAVVLTGSTSHGTVLTNSAGLTLYHFTPDGTGTPTCTGGCASLWPPLTVPSGTAHVVGAAGLSAANLGTVARSDGTLQVTYKGMPLYHYTGDTKAGDANGQGVGGIWFAVTASSAAPATTTPTTAKSSGGYGY
jgi:predicted lipoprotein with Yx(FWY)xxD motif